MDWVLIIMGFLLGCSFVVTISYYKEVRRLKKEYEIITKDFEIMGESVQKCFNDVCDHINGLSATVDKHSKAIDYITEELK